MNDRKLTLDQLLEYLGEWGSALSWELVFREVAEMKEFKRQAAKASCEGKDEWERDREVMAAKAEQRAKNQAYYFYVIRENLEVYDRRPDDNAQSLAALLPELSIHDCYYYCWLFCQLGVTARGQGKSCARRKAAKRNETVVRCSCRASR